MKNDKGFNKKERAAELLFNAPLFAFITFSSGAVFVPDDF